MTEYINAKFATLKAYLIETGEATAEELENITSENSYNDHCNTFEIIGNEYKVLSDTEADNEAKRIILDSLWAFNAEFILYHTEFYNNSTDYEDGEFINGLRTMQEKLCESANSIVKALITDIDEFVNDAIEADGRGHFISYYDGEEIESGMFYIYRTN